MKWWPQKREHLRNFRGVNLNLIKKIIYDGRNMEKDTIKFSENIFLFWGGILAKCGDVKRVCDIVMSRIFGE